MLYGKAGASDPSLRKWCPQFSTDALKTESIIQLDAKTGLRRFESGQIIFLPAVIKHDKKFIAGFQNPAQAALKTDISGICVVLNEVGERYERGKGVIQTIHEQACIIEPFFQIKPVLFDAEGSAEMAALFPG